MKAATIIGILLIVLGLGGLVAQGISWQTEETVIDLGPLEAKKEEQHHVPIPPIAGALALAGGVALVLVGAAPRPRAQVSLIAGGAPFVNSTRTRRER